MNKLLSLLLWPALAIIGAFSFAALALGRGESVNAIWLVTAALSVYLIAYRFYSKFIADKVLRVDPSRPTPAVRHNDGLDYVPTNKWILYGHHFAAIAGAGPLVGPVLAAQMGFLPGTLWILVGVVTAGAVQDFIVLFVSVRRDGKSLGEMIKMELGPIPGSLALVGVLAIMIIILAVLALVVVKALTDSPWGLFTIFATIPIALLMGCYMRIIRPGRVGEASAFGVVLLLLSLVLGRAVAADPTWGPMFTLNGEQLAWALIIYGAIAASLPVWLMLAPRDYLSTFLKIGTIVALAARHLLRRADAGHAGHHSVHRRHWAGLLRQALPVPVHHHRVRVRLGLSCPDLVGDDAEDDRERIAHALDRLRWHAGRVVRRGDGAHGRLRARSRRLLRDERPCRGHRHDGRQRGPGHLELGLHDHAGDDHPDRARYRRNQHPVARWRRADAGCRDGADPRDRHWAANPWRRSGTTSRSCSRRCSS